MQESKLNRSPSEFQPNFEISSHDALNCANSMSFCIQITALMSGSPFSMSNLAHVMCAKFVENVSDEATTDSPKSSLERKVKLSPNEPSSSPDSSL